MTGYLIAVATSLACRGCDVVDVHVRAHPHEALGGCLDLEPDPRAASGAGSARMRVGWHEELGWWAEHISDSSDRRGLCWFDHADATPPPTEVADFVAALARGEDLGSPRPRMRRYRLLSRREEFLSRLVEHVDRVSPSLGAGAPGAPLRRSPSAPESCPARVVVTPSHTPPQESSSS